MIITNNIIDIRNHLEHIEAILSYYIGHFDGHYLNSIWAFLAIALILYNFAARVQTIYSLPSIFIRLSNTNESVYQVPDLTKI